MCLLKTFNKRATIENVKETLSSCRLYLNVLNSTFRYTFSVDYMFKIDVDEIDINKQTAIATQAQEDLTEIFKALNRLSDVAHRKIIYEKYITKYKNKDVYIADKTMYSEREFYRILELALLEFSEVYNFGELMVFD